MRKISLIFLIIILFVSCQQSKIPDISDPGWEIKPPNTEPNNIAVMTYNIRHCSPYTEGETVTSVDVQATVNTIKRGCADIVFLQEVDNFTKRSGSELGQAKVLADMAKYPYYQFYKSQNYDGGEFGVTILSKYKLSNIEKIELPRKEVQDAYVGYGVLACATVQVTNKTILIATTHLSLEQENRNMQIKAIDEFFKNTFKHPIIFGGDFNATPTNSTIKYLDDSGFIRSGKDKNMFTITSIKPTREIDYICYYPKTAFKEINHTVIYDTNASDHLPVVSILKIL